MLSLAEMIKIGEDMLQDDEVPHATRASLYRTLLELRGFIGAKATRSVDGDTDGHEKSEDELQAEIDALEEELAKGGEDVS